MQQSSVAPSLHLSFLELWKTQPNFSVQQFGTSCVIPTSFTLGAHAQRGLQYCKYLCVCVGLSVIQCCQSFGFCRNTYLAKLRRTDYLPIAITPDSVSDTASCALRRSKGDAIITTNTVVLRNYHVISSLNKEKESSDNEPGPDVVFGFLRIFS